MTYVSVIAVIALLASFAVFLSGRGLARDISDVRQIVGRSRPVNVAAFRQLQDPRDTAFLRRQLSDAAFRKVQRLRARAEMEYLLDIFYNSAILVRVGDLARATAQPELVSAGTQLLNAAIEIRLHAAAAILRAGVHCVWPLGLRSDEPVIGQYELLRDRVAAIALMQAPTESSRVAAAI